MILSICMMVKDESVNLDRCLRSLDNLRKRIDSELIIVDTGSTDSTLEIAKKYTDHIYSHPWNHNFSQMRNITIQYAKGDWIFIIDADEVLSEDEGVIEYFESPLKNKFNTLSIRLRNFIKTNNVSDFSELMSLRFFRNDGDFHYESVVHNIPIYKEPISSLKGLIGHFGYINDDLELMNRKFERTQKLLLEALDNEPQNIYYRYQLSVTYAMNQAWDEAEKEVLRAYNNIMGLTIREKNAFFYVYGQLFMICKHFEKYEALVKFALEALTIRKDDIDTHFFIADAYVSSGMPSDALPYYEKYLILVAQFENHEMFVNVDVKIETIAYKKKALYNLFMIAFNSGAFNRVLDYAKQFISMFCGDATEQQIYKIILSSAFELDLPRFIVDFYLMIHPDAQYVLEKQIELLMPTMSSGFRAALVNDLTKCRGTYGAFNQLRKDVSKKSFSFQDLENEFLKFKTIDSTSFADLMLELSIIKNDFAHFIKWVISLEDINFQDLFARISLMNLQFKENFLNQAIAEDVLLYKELQFYIIGYEYFLLEDLKDKSNPLNRTAFIKYIKLKRKRMEKLYKPIVLLDESQWTEIDDAEDRRMLYLYQATVVDPYTAVSYLKKVMTNTGEFQPYIFDLIENIKNIIERGNVS